MVVTGKETGTEIDTETEIDAAGIETEIGETETEGKEVEAGNGAEKEARTGTAGRAGPKKDIVKLLGLDLETGFTEMVGDEAFPKVQSGKNHCFIP